MRTAKFASCAIRPLTFTLLLCLSWLCGAPAQGQIYPVDVTTLKGNETDPSIAMSSNLLCVAAQIDGISPGLCVSSSTNLGQTWTTNIIATNNDVSGLVPAYGEPSVAWDSYGNLFLAYLPATYEGIALAVSTNGGASFTALTNLVPLDSTEQPRLTSPQAGVATGTVWVVYKDYTLANTPLVAQGLQSTGLGTNGTFGPPEIVPNHYGKGTQINDEGFADLSVGPSGQVMVVFQDDLEDEKRAANIYVSVNTNAILNFPTNATNFTLIVNDYTTQAVVSLQGTLPGYSYQILTNGNTNTPNWGVAQTLLASNSLTVSAPISEASGPLFYEAALVQTNAINVFSAGFGSPVVVATDAIPGVTYIEAAPDGAGLNAAPGVAWDCDPYSPTLGQAYVVYTGGAAANETNLLINFAISANNGTTWSAPAQVNDDNGGTDRFLPRLAVDSSSGIVAVSWLDCRNDLGPASAEEIRYANWMVTISNFVVTNITITNYIATVTDPVPQIGNGTNFTLSVVGVNMYGNSLSLANGAAGPVIYIHGATTNVGIFLSGTNTTPGPPATNSILILNITNIFPNTYTAGVGNQGAVMYSALSEDGGQSFEGNQPVVNTNTTINPPATGLISLFAGSSGLTGWGNYTGLTGSGGNFYFVWPDNSDITTNNPDGDTNNFDIYLSSTGVPTADLLVTITNSPNPVLSDGVLVYTVTVENRGPDATYVSLLDILSTNVTLESVIPALGGEDEIVGNQIFFYWPNLGSGASLVSTIRVAATKSALVTNIAIVDGEYIDLVPTNNSVTNVLLIAGQDLALSMYSSATNVFVGQTVTNWITITNLGPAANGPVFVTNVLSTNWGGITVETPGTYTITNNTIVMDLGLMASNQVVTNVVTAVVLNVNQMILATNSALVTSQDVDTNLANNSAVIDSFILTEDLALTMVESTATLQVGQTVNFTNYIYNIGNATNGAAILTNTFSSKLGNFALLTPSVTYTITNNAVVVNVGILGIGQTVPIVITATALAIGNGTNSGAVFSPAIDPSLLNNTSREVVTISQALPMISNVMATGFATSAFISWKTGAPATGQVQYGLTSSYGSLSSLLSPLSTQHVVLLTGLASNTNYYFQIQSRVGSTLYTTNGTFSTTNTLILNTGDASYSGLWTGTSVGSNIYGNTLGSYYQIAQATNTNPTASATYSPVIVTAGDYDVSVWYPTSTNFTTNAQMYVSGATNEIIDSVNETIRGGSWQPLATNLYFASGTSGHVTIYNDTGETTTFVAANAMKWAYNTNQDYAANGTVPAWWSTYYFGTNSAVSASSDSDGDGYSNYAEYVFGTAPNDPNSHLIFQVTPGASNTVSVTFSPYQGGRIYQLQAAASISSQVWTTLTNQASTDTNGNGIFTVSESAGTNSFYRLSATLAP